MDPKSLQTLHIYGKLKATTLLNAIKYGKLKKERDEIFKLKKHYQPFNQFGFKKTKHSRNG